MYRVWPEVRGRGPFQRCARCGGPLDTLLDEEVLQKQSRDGLGPGPGSMWRFGMFLPVLDGTRFVSAGEGGTPLRRLGSWPGRVWVKDESRDPTGSFKDRGASLAITCLARFGVRRVVLSSEGNAGCSFALYSRMAGVQCHVFLPKEVNPVKVLLSRKLGAKMTKVDGTMTDAGRRADIASKKQEAYDASTFVTPYRHDGKGTMALEICEQLGWRSPDWIV